MSTIYRNGVGHDNPLARFKSYSYYHALAVCDSSDTAIALAEATAGIVNMWLHPTMREAADGSLGPYSPKQITTNSGQTGQYVVLINGATDAHVSITKVAYQTLAAAGATNNDKFTSLAVEGSMELSEPRGISFLDIIVRACLSLGKDAAHVTFVLKTFFVGVNDEDEIETISNITPLMFVVIDVTGTFTEMGGQYKLDFVALSNGVSRLPQYDRMVRTANIKGATLSEAVDSLEREVATTYARMFSCVYEQVKKAEPELGYQAGEITNKLRRVQYNIELSPMYMDSRYKFTPPSQQNGNTGACDEPGSMTTGTDTSLESALHLMMQRCPQVEQDSKDGIQQEFVMADGRTLVKGTKMQYKIHTSLCTSVSEDEAGKTSYTVTYRVEPYPVPRSFIGADEKTIKEFVEPNTIHFDYIYTGKNVDILEFDMKVNMGLAYLQLATLTNTYKGQGDVFSGSALTCSIDQVDRAQNRMTTSSTKDKKVEIPVFFSTNLELPTRRTTTSLENTSMSNYNLIKHSSIEVLDVSMKITGNLTLLNSALSSSYPRCGSKQQPANQTDMMDWGMVPGYAKIKVKMPANSDDIGLFAGEYGQSNYAKDFWYDGYYFILGVEHVFDDGEFVQNLEMIGVPNPDLFKDVGQRKADASKFSTDVSNCFNNVAACPGGTEAATTQNTSKQDTSTVANSPAAQNARRQPIPQLPSTDVDKLIHNMPASNVVTWDRMDPNVRTAISREVAGDRIPLSTYIAIAAIESEGNPAATSPTGAAGVFQFVQSTWNDVMPGHRVPANPDPRRDPTLSAQAARKYLNKVSRNVGGSVEPTWLFMGHNLGPNAARAVQRAVSEGRCIPMTVLYTERGFRPFRDQPTGPNQWLTFARGNGYDPNSTTCTIRDQVAAKYMRYVKDANIQVQAPGSAPAAVGAQTAVQPQQQPAAPTSSPSPNGRVAGQGAAANGQNCASGASEPPREEAAKPQTCNKDAQVTENPQPESNSQTSIAP